MKDLDFDEIDRAVNSLKSDAETNNDSIVNPARSTDATNPPQTLAKRRSSGQFMDVVHPSSNMRRAPLISHERPSISTPNQEPIEKLVEPSENIAPTETNSPEQPVESNWPDPIDFQKNHDDNSSNQGKTDQQPDEDADIDKISDDITNELSQKSEEESPDSPFISGTKVEKRPLGAFSTEPTPEKTDNTDEEKGINENNDENKEETEPSVEKPDEPLPEELQDDLLLIESGEGSTSPVEKLIPAENPVIKEESLKEEVQQQPVGPTSITQQYKEQPSTGEQSTGAIYNTDAYHKPLVKPAKSKSSWMWVVWILILIIVGVGAGVAVYKYAIPLL